MKFPKWMLVSAIVVGVAAGGVSGVYLWQRTNASKAKPAPVAPATAQEEVATWTDPAGFTFQYPKALAVDKHEEDQDNYAHVELTSKDHPGSIIVWAKDTTATDVNAWVKTEKQFAGATVADATMSGKPAKKIILADASKTIVGTIDEDILFTIETLPTDASYWNRIHAMIVGSFTLTQPKQESTTSDTSGGDGAVDEEEVLE
ncbi:MAG: hypothetical protein AAB803_02555 [Patescibacteria group bacterium]